MKYVSLLKSKKRIAIVALAIILIVSASVGGTAAYLSGSDEVKNTLTIGNVDITLDEPNWDPDLGLNLKPGKVTPKDPTVTAVSGNSYMRIRMEIVDGEDKLITDEARINMILKTLWYAVDVNTISADKTYSMTELESMVTEGKLMSEYNKSQFAFAGIQTDTPAVRYYNYIANSGIFSAGQKDTATLFTHVIIPNSWHNTELFTISGSTFEETENGSVEIIEKGSGYKIILSSEAIQSANMGTADEAFLELDNITKITRDTSVIAA